MTRSQTWLPALFAASLLVAACGDDDGDGETVDGGLDGGSRDGGLDGGIDSGATDSGTTVKVSNVGASCTTVANCTGASPSCNEALTFGPTSTSIPYPNGSVCTATCAATAECGTGGLCPVGDVLKLAASFGMAEAAQALVGTSSVCMKSCTLTPPSGCSDGYACVNLVALAPTAPDGGSLLPPAFAALPELNNAFCVPDAGL